MNKTDGPSGHIRFPKPPPHFLSWAGPDWASLRLEDSRLGIVVLLQTSVPVSVSLCVRSREPLVVVVVGGGGGLAKSVIDPRRAP